MAYADREMSGNRITAFVIVALIHVAAIYALVTGLAYNAVQQVIKKVTTVDIKKDEPKPPPPPPPPKNAPPPPPVAPPVKINVAVTPPQIQTVQTPPPPAPVVVLAPPAPVAPPPPKFAPKGPKPKNDQASWVTTDDYPSRALRENRTGLSGFSLTVGPDGRVTDCQITSSSGSPDLDEAACTYAKRRARFAAATDGSGSPTSGSYPGRVRWVVPKE